MSATYWAIMLGVALWVVAMLFIGGLLYAEGQRNEYDRREADAR